MKDIIGKYKKHNLINNIWIVAASLVIAIGINFFVLDGQVWDYVKTSVLEAGENSNLANIYLKNTEESIKVFSNKDMSWVNELSLSIVYNPENVTLWKIYSTTLPSKITNIANEQGLSTLLVQLDSDTDISSGEEILQIEVTKTEQQTENLNIINANFSDNTWEKYLLSTSGIIF